MPCQAHGEAHALDLQQDQVAQQEQPKQTGKIMTWGGKKRVIVSPFTCSPPAENVPSRRPPRHDSRDLRAHQGGIVGQFIPGEQIAAEPETQRQPKLARPRPRSVPAAGDKLA